MRVLFSGCLAIAEQGPVFNYADTHGVAAGSHLRIGENPREQSMERSYEVN